MATQEDVSQQVDSAVPFSDGPILDDPEYEAFKEELSRALRSELSKDSNVADAVPGEEEEDEAFEALKASIVKESAKAQEKWKKIQADLESATTIEPDGTRVIIREGKAGDSIDAALGMNNLNPRQEELSMEPMVTSEMIEEIRKAMEDNDFTAEVREPPSSSLEEISTKLTAAIEDRKPTSESLTKLRPLSSLASLNASQADVSTLIGDKLSALLDSLDIDLQDELAKDEDSLQYIKSVFQESEKNDLEEIDRTQREVIDKMRQEMADEQDSEEQKMLQEELERYNEKARSVVADMRTTSREMESYKIKMQQLQAELDEGPAGLLYSFSRRSALQRTALAGSLFLFLRAFLLGYYLIYDPRYDVIGEADWNTAIAECVGALVCLGAYSLKPPQNQ